MVVFIINFWVYNCEYLEFNYSILRVNGFDINYLNVLIKKLVEFFLIGVINKLFVILFLNELEVVVGNLMLLNNNMLMINKRFDIGLWKIKWRDFENNGNILIFVSLLFLVF